jgi:hypothetical protein
MIVPEFLIIILTGKAAVVYKQQHQKKCNGNLDFEHKNLLGFVTVHQAYNT